MIGIGAHISRARALQQTALGGEIRQMLFNGNGQSTRRCGMSEGLARLSIGHRVVLLYQSLSLAAVRLLGRRGFTICSEHRSLAHSKLSFRAL